MPIKLLKNIKRASTSSSPCFGSSAVIYTNRFNKHILGAYFFSCKDLESTQPLFNDGIPSLIFMPTLSNEVVLRQSGNIMKLKPVWLCCGLIRNTQWEIPPDLEYIIVFRFNPVSFYAIFNLDPTIFRKNPVCSFVDLVADEWKSVITEMYKEDSIEGKIDIWNATLSNYEANHYLPPLVQSAVDRIEESNGNLSVLQLIERLGGKINYKWLQRNFVRYLGIAPKKYISLQRFIYIYSAYDEAKASNNVDALLSGGYYDYNHFFKDFKQYLGVAPTQYVWD